MKFNLFPRLLFVAILAMVLLSACAPTVQGLVGLPDDAKLLVMTLVTAGLAALLLWLGNLAGLELGGWVQPLAAVIAPLIITVIEHFLGMIDPIFDAVLLTVIHYLVLLLGGIGSVVLFRRVKDQQTKALLA